MELTHKNIEQYIDRFLEGETTNAEEQALYRFFREGDIPAHLKKYAPMFAWYEGGMQGTPEAIVEKEVVERRFRIRIPIAAWSAGIAAMLVIALGLGTLFSSEANESIEIDEWACYEGSYIEIEGKRISDLKQILPILLEEQAEAELKEKRVEKHLREAERKEKRVKDKEMMVN